MTPLGIIPRVVKDLSIHFVVTSVCALLVYLMTKNMRYAVIFIATGLLVDLDHLIDYGLFFKHRFNLRAFLNCLYLKSGRIYLFMHSWELVCLILATSVFSGSLSLFVLTLSLALHMAIDNLQRKDPMFYFFVYRAAKRFEAETLLPEYRNPLSKRILEAMYAANPVSAAKNRSGKSGGGNEL